MSSRRQWIITAMSIVGMAVAIALIFFALESKAHRFYRQLNGSISAMKAQTSDWNWDTGHTSFETTYGHVHSFLPYRGDVLEILNNVDPSTLSELRANEQISGQIKTLLLEPVTRMLLERRDFNAYFMDVKSWIEKNGL